MESNYMDFLLSKMQIAKDSGFAVDAEAINPALMPHQKDAVMWALKGGRRALFESYGLGKTVQELEFCKLAAEHCDGQALIVLPLGVKQEFTRDAVRILGYEAPPYVTTMEEVKQHKDSRILITNYERVRDGDIEPKYFSATSLDEASVLRSFGSKTYQTFLQKFKGVPFKLVATATPAPNKYKEMIHYAGYLEIADTGSALTKFFKRDSTKANNLTLYPTRAEEFWLWVSSWALFITKPSDLNLDYSDEGYDLPPLEVRWHEIPIEYGKTEEEGGQIALFEEAAQGLKEAARVKRDSMDARIAEMARIVNESPDDHFILWHDREEERHKIKKALPGVVDIYGTMDYDEREQRVIDFSDGKIKLFATKQSLSGSGCNFQRFCHRAIYVGIDYKANDFMQSIHRIYRFLQSEKVIIDIIYMENERGIKEALQKKWENHDKMVEKMVGIVKKYGLNQTNKYEYLRRKMGVEIVQVTGEHYQIANADCVEYAKTIPDNSVGMVLTSIPFSNHFEYSLNYNDFGYNETTGKFFEQLDFLTPELLRILKPGRVMCVHVKDRVLFASQTGYGAPSMEPFHAMCIQHYMKHGFMYFGMITITTDVVRENNQTYRLGYTKMLKDGSNMGVGCPEYLLLFRKLPSDTSDGWADERVTKDREEYSLGRWQLDAHAFWRSDGNTLLDPEELTAMKMSSRMEKFRRFNETHIYNYQEHVNFSDACEKIGLEKDGREGISKEFMTYPPASVSGDVWDDIVRIKTLNAKQARKKNVELHVCPFPLDIVERAIERWSCKGDIVFDPFNGLGSTVMTAIKMGRFGIGSELNAEYFADSVKYCEAAEAELNAPTIFDFLEKAE